MNYIYLWIYDRISCGVVGFHCHRRCRAWRWVSIDIDGAERMSKFQRYLFSAKTRTNSFHMHCKRSSLAPKIIWIPFVEMIQRSILAPKIVAIPTLSTSPWESSCRIECHRHTAFPTRGWKGSMRWWMVGVGASLNCEIDFQFSIF